ncbi:MAG TPA: outer membrane protein assembly factor BamD [Xanthobacteraceae bacterium]|nr:outer membrane protein assembly factor BamD [Xanthobacteraceae bacterium]
MIAQTAALVLLVTNAQGDLPPDGPLLRAIDQSAPRAFDPGAETEMIAARWHLTRHDPVAAINRLKIVLWQHPAATQVEEALGRLVEAYMALGIVNEAQSAAATLGRVFPGGSWYANARRLLQSSGIEPREDPRSWITRSLD